MEPQIYVSHGIMWLVKSQIKKLTNHLKRQRDLESSSKIAGMDGSGTHVMPDPTKTKKACQSIIGTQPLSMLFTMLPLEIRRLIYSILLIAKPTSNTSLLWSESLMDPPRRENEKYCSGLDPTVLRVCQQTYMEGLPVLYGENGFTFRCLGDMTFFALLAMDNSRCKSIPTSFRRNLRHPSMRTI